MPNKTTILFLIASACIIAGSVGYQKHLSRKILYQEKVLLYEDRAYFDLVDRIRESVVDKVKMRYAYTDSFGFIFPLFEVFDAINPCTNRPSEINTLVARIAENTTLSQIKKKDYSSSLEVFEDAFDLILATIDSTQLAQKPKEVPVLIIEKYSRDKDSCTITMTPLMSMRFPDSVQVYNHDQLLHVDALPFTYKGSVDGLRFITKDGEKYGKR